MTWKEQANALLTAISEDPAHSGDFESEELWDYIRKCVNRTEARVKVWVECPECHRVLYDCGGPQAWANTTMTVDAFMQRCHARGHAGMPRGVLHIDAIRIDPDEVPL